MKKILFTLLVVLMSLNVQARKDVEITVLQWNIWQEGTVVPGGYDAIVNELCRLKPDFVTLSEVRNYHNVNFTRRLVNDLKAKGLTYYSFRTDDSGLLSRYPILDSVYVSTLNKDHGSIYKLTAEVQGRKVSVYTGHLDYLDCAYYNVYGYDGCTWKECERPQSVAELLKLNDLSWRDNEVQTFINEARHDIKAGHCVVFGGDFNEPSHLDWTAQTKDLYDHHGMIVPWTVSTMLYKNGFRDAYREVYPSAITHPGFTYPSYNPAVKMEQLTWAPKADERERIDFIYYKGKGVTPISAQIFGPDMSAYRSTALKEDTKDSFVLPTGLWPTDHKGVLVKFKIR
ncbi:endonuclease/exonuclease/phosphatase family protein [Prevotella sp. S7 MS 2]|uniref:endonuclease/exonuclease/phosphatase family protein n=1 Tax=Prevotella sp. S7 MS 2 TaxID=1287488 RepID=UPI0005135BCF|nr:endonuclease/exonuclease/phosphatase family protein [Prevotella sp. S7 MS 2]KGI60995.1 endonuclease [Prevotella sp. S7 MS 2]